MKKQLSWYAGYADSLDHARRAVKIIRRCSGVIRVRRAPGPTHPIQIEADVEHELDQARFNGMVWGVLEATREPKEEKSIAAHTAVGVGIEF